MRLSRTIPLLLVAALLIAGGLMLRDYIRMHPENFPWTELDLDGPVGAFTGRKLADLTDDPAHCRALLENARIDYSRADDIDVEGSACGFADGVRFGAARAIAYAPQSPLISCPVAAALAVWERESVQPAAREIFAQDVAGIEHYGGYSCRRINGAASGRWSEHATADALDIAAFMLADGSRISVLADWNRESEAALFLRRVRDEACDLFATVLSPDYNAAHEDHFHFDQAERGANGWRGCR